MGWLIFLAVWAVGGYFFSRFFINHVLDDGRWADTGKKANPLGPHFAFPVMGPLVGLAILLDWFANHRAEGAPTLKERLIKWYGGK
jgi:hypothetical protein